MKSLERPALPFLGMQLRDQAARVAAFRKLMAQYPIEIITSGHTAPLMGPALQTAIEKLLYSIEHSPPRFLQSSNSSIDPSDRTPRSARLPEAEESQS
jgi:hypothetical protein